MIDGVGGEPVALRGIGADVGQEARVDGRDDAVAPEAHADLVVLVAVVAGRHQVLAARLHPLHGTAEAMRGRGGDDLLDVDRALGPEAAAHVGQHHADLFAGQSQHGGDGVAQAVEVLVGGADDQGAGLGIGIGQRPARLETHAGESRMAEALVDDEVRARQALLDVAVGPAGREGHVVGPPLVHARGRGHGGLRRHQRRQRLVVHGDQLQRVGQPGGIVGDHHGHGLADVADDSAREDLLGERAALVRAAVRGGDGGSDVGQVRARPHRDDAGSGQRGVPVHARRCARAPRGSAPRRDAAGRGA